MMYKISFLSCVLVLLAFNLHSQDLSGTWVVERVERILNNEVNLDFDSGSLENLMDVSRLSITYSNDGTYLGTNVYGDLVDGNWVLTSNTITHDNKTVDFNLADANHFTTTKLFRQFDVNLSPVITTIVTYYVRENLLPIELLSFSLERQKQNILLMWETSSEEYFSHFIIEKSFDGELFNQVGYVESTGSNSNYDFEDRDAFETFNEVYYRLKMQDVDYASQYSPIRRISLGESDFKVFPNPVRSVLNYKQEEGNATKYKISDVEGVDILTGQLEDAGSLDVEVLPKGVYFLVFYNDERVVYYVRVLKL